MSGNVEIDSAGTHAYHVNEPADRRASTGAQKRGYSLDGIRARRVDTTDFERFDYILAMDRDNHELLRAQSEAEHESKIQLFLEFANVAEDEVPDPYYGGSAGFERVLDLVEDASRGLLETLKNGR